VTPDSAFSVQPAAPGAARYTENGERRLRVRWLGKVAYDDALALQRGLFAGTGDHLLLLEHPPVYTLGVRADLANVLVPPAAVGAELVRADRGGDVTYHGPGQLVGYPVVNVPGKRGGGMADTVAYVRSIAEMLIDVLADLGLDSRWDQRFPGVWVDGRKIAAIGVRLSRGRSMHGFALNVDPDLTMFDHIVPCGLDDRQVTSLRAEGLDVSIDEVVELVATHASARWGAVERQDATRFQPPASDGAVTPVKLAGRLAQAGVVGGLEVSERKPEWLRAPLRLDVEQRRLQRTMRELDLVTVCEEAGCPNLSECWSDGTATFMINGERCTRACGFCLVDTRHPEPLDVDEPERVAEAVARMGLTHAVVTAVARDDLPDGGAGAFARTIEAIRRRRPGCAVEVLISDCKGAPDALDLIYAARPDMLNHNVETVLRLQRAVRPSAGYARSLAVLARAKAAGLTTKSGIILGMGETDEEVVGALADLRGIGVDIVTLGQYLRPTARHLPVARWVRPETFTDLKAAGEAMGIPHVEASPLTRSSYHAKQAAEATA
jgi:lipoic acid synthetase